MIFSDSDSDMITLIHIAHLFHVCMRLDPKDSSPEFHFSNGFEKPRGP